MNNYRFHPPIFGIAIVAAASLLLAAAPTVHAQANLVINGDFSAGNTGFLSDYTLASGNTTNPGQYAVTTNPGVQYSGDGFNSYGDHTTGTGNMLLIDGASTATSRGWYQTLNLQANTVYIYSYWVASADALSPATVTFSAASTQVGSAFSAKLDPGVWQQTTGSFNSGLGGSVIVSIKDTNTTGVGNDFTVDDIKVTAAPEPGTIPLMLTGSLPFAGGTILIRRRKNRA